MKKSSLKNLLKIVSPYKKSFILSYFTFTYNLIRFLFLDIIRHKDALI